MKKATIYHIVATPESIDSLIQNGTFPNNIPNYVIPQQIILHDAFTTELPATHTNADQSFIVEVRLTQAPSQRNFIPSNISRIFVFSESGKSLLHKLLKTKFSKEIKIVPSLFSAWDKHAATTPILSDTYVTLQKKLKRDSADTQSTKPEPSDFLQKPRNIVTRLGNTEEHIAEITKAFIHAKEKILIACYCIDGEIFKRLDLYNLIRLARDRGVKIDIYCCEHQDVDLDVLQFLQENGVNFDQTFTHSKILAIDDFRIAVGSFDWLSGTTYQEPEVCEGTIVLEDPICAELLRGIWAHLKYYKDQQFNNVAGLPEKIASIYYKLDQKLFFQYIPTIEQHRLHCMQSLQMAKRNVIICSPFISGEFIHDINLNTLERLAQNKVEVIFVCRKDDPNLKLFTDYISEISSPYINVLSTENFHLKTIIIDDKRISEGSFSWLSVLPNERNKSQNHEATFEIAGGAAKNMIKHFYASPVGRTIIDFIIEAPSRSSSDQDSFFDPRKSY